MEKFFLSFSFLNLSSQFIQIILYLIEEENLNRFELFEEKSK